MKAEFFGSIVRSLERAEVGLVHEVVQSHVDRPYAVVPNPRLGVAFLLEVGVDVVEDRQLTAIWKEYRGVGSSTGKERQQTWDVTSRSNTPAQPPHSIRDRLKGLVWRRRRLMCV